MSLHLLHTASGVAKEAAHGLAQIVRAASPRRGALKGVELASLALMAAHPVHTITLADAIRGSLPDWEAVTRWRFLVLDEERTIAGVEVRIDPATGKPRFSRVEEGELVQGAVEAIGIVEASPAVAASTYALGLLRVPALSLEALWLRAPNPADDRFMPLAPAPKRFEAFRTYPVQAFLHLLQAEAAEHPAFDSSPRVAVSAG